MTASWKRKPFLSTRSPRQRKRPSTYSPSTLSVAMPDGYLVVNSSAGTARGPMPEACIDALREAGGDIELITASGMDGAREELTRLGEGEVHRVVVAGGDGTVHMAANALAGTKTELGILPLGSGNDFARALGLPLGAQKLREMAKAAMGPANAVDLIHTPDGYATTVAVAGFPAAVNVRAESMQLPRILNAAKYFIAAVVEVGHLRPQSVVLKVGDNHSETVELTMLAIANTPFFGNGLAVCPEASPFDSLLDVCTVGAVSRAEFLRVLPKVFRGGHANHRAVEVRRAERLVLETEGVLVRADGEPLGAGPMEFCVEKGALMVAGVGVRGARPAAQSDERPNETDGNSDLSMKDK